MRPHLQRHGGGMEKIKGYIDHIIYRNTDNGYTVFTLISDEEEITCVGTFRTIDKGENIEAEGRYASHPVYGEQFKVENYRITAPDDTLSMERYLGSGAIKGVGEALAARIVKKFGKDTFRIIEEEPERLAEVKGISERKAKEIAVQVYEKRDAREAMTFLQKYGISNTLAIRIYEAYGMNLYGVMKENPYQLAEDIDGIGFRIADAIASRIGIHTDSDYRIRSGLLFTLLQAGADGHCYLPESLLLQKAGELLELEPSLMEAQLQNLAMDKKIVIKMPEEEGGDRKVYGMTYYYAELNCAKMLHDLNISVREEDYMPSEERKILEKIGALEKELEIELDELQKKAVLESIKNGILILSGGPGTGKTTTINMIIRYFLSEEMDIFLAAPTGRAAKRMTETTGYEAKTIHRLLEYNPQDGYKRNDENPLEGDALIVDECSMIDILLMNNLLKAVPEGMRLVLVGDIDQLPSVGAGNVLRDIIDSRHIPVVRLVRIFRQAQKSRIVMSAHAINQGKFPDTSNGRDTDFFFMKEDDPERAAETVVRLVKERLPRAYRESPERIQVLTPMQRGIVGAANLNLALQEALNPSGPSLNRGGYTYRQGDRVMQIRNNYDKDVFNGDSGYIREVDTEDRTLTVDFDGKTVEYDVTELDELTLAYATTIHKAQGSEYPIVVMPLLMTHFVMLQRNLIYTGITRAKKICVLIGATKALAYAIRNMAVLKRNTMLKERIAGDLR